MARPGSIRSFFLAPPPKKKLGEWRPILTLKPQNNFMRPCRFRMEMLRAILSLPAFRIGGSDAISIRRLPPFLSTPPRRNGYALLSTVKPYSFKFSHCACLRLLAPSPVCRRWWQSFSEGRQSRILYWNSYKFFEVRVGPFPATLVSGSYNRFQNGKGDPLSSEGRGYGSICHDDSSSIVSTSQAVVETPMSNGQSDRHGAILQTAHKAHSDARPQLFILTVGSPLSIQVPVPRACYQTANGGCVHPIYYWESLFRVQLCLSPSRTDAFKTRRGGGSFLGGGNVRHVVKDPWRCTGLAPEITGRHC